MNSRFKVHGEEEAAFIFRWRREKIMCILLRAQWSARGALVRDVLECVRRSEGGGTGGVADGSAPSDQFVRRYRGSCLGS